MDTLGGNKVLPSPRKVKKKQGKEEMDRLKQAEKKKRRLEKALATSAAIRSELEKKKQKKKEEEQRLDEEGAAIAEAVALQVLGNDSEDSYKVVPDQYVDSDLWGCPNHINCVIDCYGRSALPSYWGSPNYSLEGVRWIPGADGSGFRWDGSGMLPEPNIDAVGSEYEDSWLDAIAAQAVSSLQIHEGTHMDSL
ncbi:hypothetical protein SAY86_029413 [Trapa natans]|uniref:Uncharacterized protein n=1 Tax=Trapa natans TaxID=22666 RepID=A0AAN7RBW6_TRANT|nr:hypothetical protein SAY86_029413 [Trapa natans]